MRLSDKCVSCHFQRKWKKVRQRKEKVRRKDAKVRQGKEKVRRKDAKVRQKNAKVRPGVMQR